MPKGNVAERRKSHEIDCRFYDMAAIKILRYLVTSRQVFDATLPWAHYFVNNSIYSCLLFRALSSPENCSNSSSSRNYVSLALETNGGFELGESKMLVSIFPNTYRKFDEKFLVSKWVADKLVQLFHRLLNFINIPRWVI